MPGPGKQRRWTDEQLTAAVPRARSMRQVLAQLNLKPGGMQYVLIRRRIEALGLDTTHFLGQRWNLGDPRGLLKRAAARSFDDILVQDSTYQDTDSLRRRLLRAGMLDKVCAICRLPPTWCERPLVLRLDHVNGDRADHRLENLRLLCPNCDSQTPTFAGRNKGRARRLRAERDRRELDASAQADADA